MRNFVYPLGRRLLARLAGDPPAPGTDPIAGAPKTRVSVGFPQCSQLTTAGGPSLIMRITRVVRLHLLQR